ncbi:MAG TPA: metal-dependent hydrolase [Thermomonas sp.]|uniref:metal-dependent hydrolase n=1 Tax=Thermomonas sp. TaxID=1971895 RepID=UPI001EC62146|nr:metal-dependent hydrolase [Thermomonas sp.]MBK6416687.1 metal-dependent hydrolase [Thermomonas sp.]HQW59232.1 metal-dependent hydrolase [Thermomonas sp.]HQY82011.1 metal-dependent hydrolase [Thermomonas sp.]HRA02075.1 metal-dependent hydrolase [Thermomonas sp.]
MDSLTQIVLGGAVAAAIAPAPHRRAALLAGAMLGTLPDLDALPLALLTDDPVARMTWHRSASHSLFVLPLLGWAIWALFRRSGGRVAESPLRWFWAIQLALVTHPLLDAFTVYGTQLWWPLPMRSVMWSSVFIIDPLYTIWLLAACIAAWWLRERIAAQRVLLAGLVLSSAYLAWSLLAKVAVDREAGRALAAIGLADAPRFSVPMPFNTVLWRVVAMTPQGFVEGERSLLADSGPMVFRGYRSNLEALRAAQGIAAVQRLDWFNHGFQKAQVRDGVLVLSDLRMGAEPDYTFNFAVAERDGNAWRAIPPEQLRWPWQATRRLTAMWERIWTQPALAQAAAGNPVATPAASASK